MQATFQSQNKTIRVFQTEPDTQNPHPAILLLHGAGGNTGFWLDRITPFASRLGVALYAPHYFDRTGTERADTQKIQDGVHVPLWLATVADSLAYLRSRPDLDAGRIALLGVSLGAFLSLAHVAVHPGVKAIVEISGGLVEPYAAKATPAFPPTLILHGAQDEVVPVSQAHALASRLKALNVQHESQILSGEGHWFSQGAQLRLLAATAAFLGRHL